MVAGLKQLPREIHKHIRARGYIGSAALGVSDGLVTNLAFLSGIAGATGATGNLGLIRLAGFASMLAGAISMFFSGVLAWRSEYELFQADARREAGEIEEEPEEEKTELRDFYIAKGLSSEQANEVVERISKDKSKFLEDILMHELHVHKEKLANPFKMGGVIGLSFLVGALIPLAPFLLLPTRSDALFVAIVVSPIFLFLVGSWRGRVVGRESWKDGVETVLIGVAASALVYLVGSAFVFL